MKIKKNRNNALNVVAPHRGTLERFPITWNHVIEKESLNINKLEQVLIEKVEQLFRDML